MCNKRYINKPKNKEMGSVSGKTDSPMSLLSCSRFSGWIPIWSTDAIPRNPGYSVSFSPLIFLLHYPFLISLYLWLNMYFSKDVNSIPTFESPWIHQGWTRAVVPFSSCLQSFLASGSFQMSQFFTSGGQSIGVSVQQQSFQWMFRTDFL